MKFLKSPSFTCRPKSFRACKVFQIILLDKIIPFIHAKIDICKSLTISVRNNGRRKKNQLLQWSEFMSSQELGFDLIEHQDSHRGFPNIMPLGIALKQ